jgi:branched-chain amino acid transport system substrate-binding protein
VLGARIEILAGDHQNKPDVGLAIARSWLDEQKVAAIADVPTSSVAFAVQDLTRQKQRVFLDSGAAAAELSGRACSPFSVHTADDTYSLSVGTARAAVASGLKTWFFLTADFVFGHALQAESTRVIEADGGRVLGAVLHPPGTADFSSFLLRAQASQAQAIGLANAGTDTVNTIKQAAELGISAHGQRLVGLILFITDIHALGLETAQGLLLTAGFYWDMNDDARSWSRRFMARTGKMPTREQATTYATVLHYLHAVEAAGSDDAATVVARMKATPMPYFGTMGTIRRDGRFVHDLTLYEVKSPAESHAPWDYYRPLRVLSGAEAFVSLADSACSLAR